MKSVTYPILAVALLAAVPSAFGNVLVTNPHSGETVNVAAQFVASANTTTCSRGVASMGIYVDNRLQYVVKGIHMNTSLAMAPGKHNVVVQEWDYCGGATKTAMPLTVAVQAGIWPTSPTNGSTVTPQANFVASATTSCPTGVSGIGVYVNNQLAYKSSGNKLNAQVNLPTGLQHTKLLSFDNCGGVATAPIDVNVQSPKNIFTNLQASPNWKSSGQIAPDYQDCDSSCNGVTFSLHQGIANPSLSGKAAEVDLGGTRPYSDVLYYNQLIGAFSTQGMTDQAHTVVPGLHDFTYDAYFLVPDPLHTHAMEFDINWFMGGTGITWGTECRGETLNEWAIWDNVGAKWVSTGIACNMLTNAWNHVTITAQRGPNNEVIYKSITLNGNTAVLNKTYPPFKVPANWYGVTVNYQMDGDKNQTSIKSYVDNLSLSYQ